MSGADNNRGARQPLTPMRIIVGLALVGVVLFQLWQKKLEQPPQPRIDEPIPQNEVQSRPTEPTVIREAAPPTQAPKQRVNERSPKVPDKVLTVLAHVDKAGEPLAGYEGGRKFLNLGRDGEEKLPQRDARGKSIDYREWDVNPHVAGKNRGAERLVTGSDGSAYFTSDHYRTYTKVR